MRLVHPTFQPHLYNAAPPPPPPCVLQLHAVLGDVVAAVSAQVVECEAAAPLRGGLTHLLLRCSLPRPPPPDHVVEDVLL